MKFLQYLNEASIEINQSMENFADNVINKLHALVESHVTYTWFERKLDKTKIYKGRIETKYANKDIEVYLDIDNNKKFSAYQLGNTIHIVFSEYIYNKFKNGSSEDNSIRRIILHELIHTIDPKLNNSNLNQKSDKVVKMFSDEVNKLKKIIVYTGTFDEKQKAKKELVEIYKKYYKFPWELDAYISTEAREVFNDIKKKSKTKKDALNYLKNYVPENSLLKLYHDDEKIWKRFILSINKLIDKDFK